MFDVAMRSTFRFEAGDGIANELAEEQQFNAIIEERALRLWLYFPS